MYVLRVHAAAAEVPPDEHPIALCRVDEQGTTVLASHDTGFSLAHIEGIPLAELLDRSPDAMSPKAWLRHAGVALYERLAPGPIDRALSELDNGSVTLDARSPELLGLPWEIVRRQGMPRPLFSDPRNPWLCGTANTRIHTRLVPNEWPLRMLVVVGSAPDDTAVQAVEESYAIEDLTRGRSSTLNGPSDTTTLPGAGPDDHPNAPQTRCDVLLNTLFHPDLDHIERALQRFKPHVFHFIGHGSMEDGDPELCVFSKTDDSYHTWGYDQIATAFDLEAVPRLVYLDACHSGFDGPDGWSLTQAFRDIGVTAVVSMRRQVLGSTAVACAHAFYSRLLAGDSVAHALADARRTLMAGDGESEWYVPRLWVRGAPEDTLHPGMSPDHAARADLLRCPGLDSRLCFVDRWPQRYHAWRDVPAAEQAGLLVVHGAQSTGRTSFVHLLMESQALSGRVVHYVDFRGLSGDYLDILDQILAMRTDDGQCSYIRAPFTDAAFHKFLDRRPTGDARQNKVLIGNMRDQLMAAFWDGLRASAAQTPLFLVLDHLDPDRFLDEVVAEQIAYQFFHRCRPPDTRHSVRAVLVLDEEQAKTVRKQPFRTRPPTIQLEDFTDEELDYYMPLYFAWRQLADPDASHKLQEFIKEFQIACPAGFHKAQGLLELARRKDE